MGDLQKDKEREREKSGGEKHKTARRTGHAVITPVRIKGGEEVKE